MKALSLLGNREAFSGLFQGPFDPTHIQIYTDKQNTDNRIKQSQFAAKNSLSLCYFSLASFHHAESPHSFMSVILKHALAVNADQEMVTVREGI